MRNDFLGDSLDMAKRALLALSAQAGYRIALYALPSKDKLDFDLYKKMFIPHSQLLISNPSSVFGPPTNRQHLFSQP